MPKFNFGDLKKTPEARKLAPRPAVRAVARQVPAMPRENWDNIRFLSAFAHILSIKDYRVMKKAALKAAIAARLLEEKI